MAQLAALPEDSWQHVVCRICGHPFAILVENAQDPPVLFCQTCTLLVDWFGQEEEASPPPPPPPAVDSQPQKRARKARRQESREGPLASLLDRWGELWRSSEEQE